jgi:phosphotransferase system  glucose/maltose/N-acetylglucosamine-specific IIC component
VKALTRLTSGLLVFLGIAIVVRTIEAGGGATAFGLVVGLLFVAAGAGRLYISRDRDDPEERE